MIKHLLTCVAFIFFATLNAQVTLRPSEQVELAAAKHKAERIDLFKESKVKTKQLNGLLDDFKEFEIDPIQLLKLKQSNSELIELDLQLSHNETITLQLVRTDLFDDNDYVKTYPSKKLVDVEVGAHFRGIIKGQPETVVSFSAFNKEVMGLASGLYGSNLVIGRLEGNNNHVIYLDNQIAKHQNFECEVPDDQVSYTKEELSFTTELNREGPQCVRFYIEVNNDIYRNKGSEAATSNFITGMMNQVMTLYANENINTKLMPLAIWTGTSPYNGTTTRQLLTQFQQQRPNWDGDLGQLLGYAGGGGLAQGFSGICNSDRRESMSYSGIQANYSIVPTFSWTVQVVTHEFGHTFGSRHTHACVWNGNGTAIDGCSGFTEGSCSIPGIPSGGGTIMSYCHQSNVGINLARGFGTQPGNVIRNRVANGNCLVDCSANPDPSPTDCSLNSIEINVTTDNYPSETSWTLTNENGQVVATGGNYSGKNTNYTKDLCLEDGCYTFNINDSYGDGICCSYGSGSYNVTFNGEPVATGGAFGSTESTEFCVESNPVPACIDTSLTFKTDNYPQEMSWRITNANNEVIGEGDNLANKNYIYTVQGCLDPGCYTISFTDSYGDGFCCSYGEGYYQFSEGSNLLLNENADFGRTVSHTVCVGNGLSMSQDIVLEREIPEFTTDFNVLSPFNEEFKVQFDKTKETLVIDHASVRNINGKEVFEAKNIRTDNGISANSATWDKGVYILVLRKGKQTESVKVIKK